jgi:hypothetical protein
VELFFRAKVRKDRAAPARRALPHKSVTMVMRSSRYGCCLLVAAVAMLATAGVVCPPSNLLQADDRRHRGCATMIRKGHNGVLDFHLAVA